MAKLKIETIPIFKPLSLLLNTSGGGNGSFTNSEVSLRFFDIDGDGLADRVFNVSGSDELYVQLNKLGKVGLLKKITLPTGGEYNLKYERKGNTVDMPQCRYVLSEVVQKSNLKYESNFNGIENEQEYKTSYSYDGGYYDRNYKEFFGFRKLIARTASGKEKISEYFNREYYSKGMLKKQSVKYDGKTYQESSFDLDVAPYARVKKETLTQIEYSSNVGKIITGKKYEYDSFGNVNEFTR